MARQLVKEVNNTRIIVGRSSIQGILKDMGTFKTEPGGSIQKSSSAFFCSSELSSALVEDPAAVKILTDLYDRIYNAGDWTQLLKSDNFTLVDPILTMLSATNAAMSEDFLDKTAIHGGYIARTFIIYETERQAINSLMFKPERIVNYKEEAKYLKEISRLRGEVIMSHDCRLYFDSWYREFISNIDRNQIRDPTGTLNRFDDSVLKVAILLSLGNEPKLILCQTALEQAITYCETLIGNVRKTTLKTGEGKWAAETGLLIEELVRRDNHIISRQMVSKMYWAYALASEWDEIAFTLEAAGIIKIEVNGNNILYKMSDEEADKWKRHWKEKFSNEKSEN